MVKVFATNLFVSKGYEDNPALKYFGDDNSCVQFRVGEKVYDKDAKDNTRWVNHTVKAFGDACERIKKMQMKEGSLINITGGTLVEDVWTEGEGDKKTTKRAQYIRLDSRDSIEYVSGGGKKSADDKQSSGSSQTKGAADKSDNGKTAPTQSESFDGFSPYGDKDFF